MAKHLSWRCNIVMWPCVQLYRRAFVVLVCMTWAVVLYYMRSIEYRMVFRGPVIKADQIDFSGTLVLPSTNFTGNILLHSVVMTTMIYYYCKSNPNNKFSHKLHNNETWFKLQVLFVFQQGFLATVQSENETDVRRI